MASCESGMWHILVLAMVASIWVMLLLHSKRKSCILVSIIHLISSMMNFSVGSSVDVTSAADLSPNPPTFLEARGSIAVGTRSIHCWLCGRWSSSKLTGEYDVSGLFFLQVVVVLPSHLPSICMYPVLVLTLMTERMYFPWSPDDLLVPPTFDAVLSFLSSAVFFSSMRMCPYVLKPLCSASLFSERSWCSLRVLCISAMIESSAQSILVY